MDGRVGWRQMQRMVVMARCCRCDVDLCGEHGMREDRLRRLFLSLWGGISSDEGRGLWKDFVDVTIRIIDELLDEMTCVAR